MAASSAAPRDRSALPPRRPRRAQRLRLREICPRCRRSPARSLRAGRAKAEKRSERETSVQQNFDLGPVAVLAFARGAAPVQARGNDFGVVDDQRIAGAEIVRQVAHVLVLQRAVGAHDQHARRIARPRRPERNQVFRQIEIEKGYVHRAKITRMSGYHLKKISNSTSPLRGGRNRGTRFRVGVAQAALPHPTQSASRIRVRPRPSRGGEIQAVAPTLSRTASMIRSCVFSSR